MKRRCIAIGICLICLLISTQSSLAFGMGNVDGVWQSIEDVNETNGGWTQGADCSRWATGPGDSATSISDWNRGVQTGSTTDENQVRYGTGTGTSDCDNDNSWAGFATQSGMGWDGNNNVGASLSQSQPFWLARFTHYNNPIQVTNNFDWIDIDVTITGILCNNGQPPSENGGSGSQTFVFRLDFDETPNNQNPCPYGGNANGCYDRIQFNVNPAYAVFTCPNDAIPGSYTISIAGFQPHTSTNCATQIYNPALISNNFITAEQTDNNACLWAVISAWDPDAIKLASFSAQEVDESVRVEWTTILETDNVGFNLYRADSPDGIRIKLNSEIIPSLVPPGSPFGASYEYFDDTIPGDDTYYYWLEDIDTYGVVSLNGPVSVSLGQSPAWPWQVFLPEIFRLP